MSISPKAYEYQKSIAKYLLHPDLSQRRNVILQAPTGAGKTMAALLPFLNAIQFGRNFPKRCIYSVPMRILANQFVSNTKSAITSTGYNKEISVAIQTGDNSNSPDLTHNLIFATIDQTLSSFLMAPYGLSFRKANLNAGALLSSYLVFDEFHLYDPTTTLPTTLYMLKQLKGIAPFILMTATFSGKMLDDLAEELDAVVVPEDDNSLKTMLDIKSQQKQRYYHTCDQVLSADAVLNAHQGRSLVICNQVDRARYMYEQLCEHKPDDVEIILLHSRFLREDRNVIEDRIRDLFAEGNTNGNYIVVSTQAIEVGVDITSTALHTELAPANAIVQRAGRCARYESDEGDVYIYRYVIDLKGKSDDGRIDLYDIQKQSHVLPYKNQQDVFRKTWEAFSDKNGGLSDYGQELAIVSYAHSDSDKNIIAQLKAGQLDHREQIHWVQDTSDKGQAKNLIRDIFQQNIIIHDNPPEIFGRELTQIEVISLHPYTLKSYISEWIEQSNSMDEVEWVVKIAYENSDEDRMQANDEDRYIVKTIWEASEAFGVPLVIVHPNFATYTPTEGFIPNRGGDYCMPLPNGTETQQTSSPYGSKGYKKETYEEHIRLVYQAFEEQWHDVAWGAQQLEHKYDWEIGSIRRAVELAVLLHDVGKLSIGWQTWAHKYQQALYETEGESLYAPDSDEAYAHTDFDYSDKHQDIQRKIKPSRPWHSVEGALAVFYVLDSELGEANDALFQAVYSAIARHHAPQSDSHGGFKLHKDTIRHIQATLPEWFQELDLTLLDGLEGKVSKQIKGDEDIAFSENTKAFLVYCLLVRALRRADQEGTRRGSE